MLVENTAFEVVHCSQMNIFSEFKGNRNDIGLAYVGISIFVWLMARVGNKEHQNISSSLFFSQTSHW